MKENYYQAKFLKRIIGLFAMCLFFITPGVVNAQVVPCIDGESTEWGSPFLQAEPTYEHRTDVFTGNMDDIYTGSKDFKLFGPNNNDVAYNEWTLSPMQAKSDIMNASAVILTNIVGTPANCSSSFGAYEIDHTYLFFAGDRESNNGVGYIGFWFLLNGTTAEVGDNGQNIFNPPHYTNYGEPGVTIEDSKGDLLILADFENGGRDAVVTVLKWVGPGNGTVGNNLSLVPVTTAAQVGQNNATQTAVPSNFVVPAGQTTYDYNEFYEGVIDLTDVFDLVNDPQALCSASWLLETRSSKEITADLKDFVGGNFNLSPTVEVNNVTVCEGESASFTATLSAGDPADYTFTWSGPGTFSGQGTNMITINPVSSGDAGTYSVVVTSDTACLPLEGASGSLTVNTVSCSITPTNPLCFGGNDGSLTAAGADGTPPYMYSLNGGSSQASGTFNGLSANILYTVTVTDANGCSSTCQVTLGQPTDLTAQCSGDALDCFGDTDGSVSVNAGGGTPPYTYLWNDAGAQTTATATGLGAGTYMVTVTDANGCTETCSAEVTEPTLLSCTATTGELACQGLPIDLSVTPAGGTPPYTYSWSSTGSATYDDATAATTVANGAVIGEVFTATVTDANGCVTTCTVEANLYDCVPECETAFGVMTQDVEGFATVDGDYSSCFRNDGFRRWGWVNTITEADQGTPVVLDLWAGAGQCDLSNGEFAGNATITYNNDGTVQVCYEMADGYVLSEAHVYVGCNPYPTMPNNGLAYTVAPGQYSFNAGDLGYVQTTFCTPEIEASGDFYVIVHGVVCATDICEGCYLPGSPNEEGMFDELDPNYPLPNCTVNTGGWGRTTVDFVAYPVPFDNEVNIKYRFEYDTKVNIEVFDIKGALITQLTDEHYQSGTIVEKTIDMTRFDNQMYFVKLTTERGVQVKKIVSSDRN